MTQINVYNFAGLYGILGAIAAILCIAEFIERCTSRGQSKNGMLETALKKFFGLRSNDDLSRLIREKDAYKGRRFANKAQLVKDVLDTYHDHASDAPGNDQKNLVLELQAPVYNYLKYQVRESSHEERQGETDGDTAPVELVLIPTLLFFWLNAVCFMIGSIGS